MYVTFCFKTNFYSPSFSLICFIAGDGYNGDQFFTATFTPDAPNGFQDMPRPFLSQDKAASGSPLVDAVHLGSKDDSGLSDHFSSMSMGMPQQPKQQGTMKVSERNPL